MLEIRYPKPILFSPLNVKITDFKRIHFKKAIPFSFKYSEPKTFKQKIYLHHPYRVPIISMS